MIFLFLYCPMSKFEFASIVIVAVLPKFLLNVRNLYRSQRVVPHDVALMYRFSILD